MLRATLIALVLSACGSSKPRVEPSPPSEPAKEAEAPTPTPTPTPTPAPPPAPASLYDRLGGKDAITAVVEEFVGRTTTDAADQPIASSTPMPQNLKKLLVEFVCMATGGPCKYTGRDMATSHAGMEVVEDEFDGARRGSRRRARQVQGARGKEKNELLGCARPAEAADRRAARQAEADRRRGARERSRSSRLAQGQGSAAIS